jgi:hypothetical protein
LVHVSLKEMVILDVQSMLMVRLSKGLLYKKREKQF